MTRVTGKKNFMLHFLSLRRLEKTIQAVVAPLLEHECRAAALVRYLGGSDRQVLGQPCIILPARLRLLSDNLKYSKQMIHIYPMLPGSRMTDFASI